MPQSKNTRNKAASGMGNIRKKTCTVNGKTYIYYEARYTEGFDPGTGKQIQRSISGKTQKEVSAETESSACITGFRYIHSPFQNDGRAVDGSVVR